jgi:hypothetical protein
VAAAPVAGLGDRRRGRRGVDQPVAARGGELVAQFRIDQREARRVRGIDALDLALQAGVVELEVEHGEALRLVRGGGGAAEQAGEREAGGAERPTPVPVRCDRGSPLVLSCLARAARADYLV